MALNSRQWRRIAFWGAFLAAFIVYWLTLERGASYWDCPEYIVTAWRLEPGHPPGNPFWTLTARVFTILGATPQNAAVAVNISSALFMALGTGLLASTAYIFLHNTFFSRRHFLTRRKKKRHNLTALPHIPSPSLRHALCAFTSFCAALCFGWADSPWFSAVEAEVYAMSLFFTALDVRLMTIWYYCRDRRQAARLLMLIVYLTGLSIGVHQLNLLVIPALALIWVFRRHSKPAPLATAAALFASFAAVAAILLGFMPGILWLCQRFELLCVNTLGWPIHSGVIICWTLLMAVAIALPFLPAAALRRHQTLTWTPALLLAGYSVYFILLVRGAANTPMNEGAPSDIFALSSYLARDQYGTAPPLLYGHTPYSAPMRLESIDSAGHADYRRYATRSIAERYALSHTDSASTYVRLDDRIEYIFPPELNMWIPRLVSRNPDDIDAYADWAGMTPEAMDSVEVSYALDSLGHPVGRLEDSGKRVKEKILRPTYLQQATYFASYQVAYMYLRYLMWNFVGKQNDRFSVGEVEHGNFITGITPADDAMLGTISDMPTEISSSNPGHNVYFAIPLLLGIIGLWVLADKHDITRRRWNFIIFILFFMTGIAIVLYLNQGPRQPRERDYSFLGSFWAYALWIAAGMAYLLTAALKTRRHKLRTLLTSLAALLIAATPLWMLAQNYDDHNRSGRHAVEDYAANMLLPLEKDAILFINGDNYTFPLWYAQEVLGMRRDVTLINTAYLVTPWYEMQLMRPGEQSAPLAMQARPQDLALGRFSAVYYDRLADDILGDSLQRHALAIDALKALRQLYSSEDASPRIHPLLRVRAADGAPGDSIVISAKEIATGRNYLSSADLITFDIIASNAAAGHPRPVYWMDLLPAKAFGGFKNYTVRKITGRKLLLAHRGDRLRTPIPEQFEFRSGGADTPGFYADATTGSMISRQRVALIRYASRMLTAGHPDIALRTLRDTQRLYPPQVWEYQITYDSDSVCHEGFEIASLMRLAATQLGDSAAIQEADSITAREETRYRQWRLYRHALPKHLRNMMTPKNRLKTLPPPQ